MLIAMDTETTGLDYTKEKIIGLATALAKKKGVYRKWGDINKEKFKASLAKDESVWHNYKYDGHMLKRAGFDHPKIHHDTMIAAFLLDGSGKHNLEAAAKKWTGAEPWKYELADWLKANGFGPGEYNKVPWDILSRYAALDVERGMDVHLACAPVLKRDKMEELYRTECELTKALIDMEDYGHTVSIETFKKLSKVISKEAGALAKSIYKEVGHKFDINKDDELAQALFEDLKLEPNERNKDGKPKMDKYALDDMHHPVCELIKQWRTANVMLSTYCMPVVDGLRAADGVMRCSFNQIGTQTGRLSCNDPNLQNVPKGHNIREAFTVRPGYKNFYFDYSNMEMMVYAHFSNDPFLKKVFAEGKDAHGEMAKEFYKKQLIEDDERKSTKTLNFLVIYGGGIRAITRKFHKTRQEARDILNRYYYTFPNLRKFSTYIMDKVKAEGGITNPFGRRRRLDADDAYKGVNTLVQGTCGDVMKKAMVRIHKELKGAKSRMLLTIHDELVPEIHPSEEKEVVRIIKNAMEDFPQFSVPLKVDIKWTATTWKDKQPYKEEA
jgi:DNA polymerase-1